VTKGGCLHLDLSRHWRHFVIAHCTKPLTKARYSVIVDPVPHALLPPAKLEDWK
jgi:hypothetical protein